MEIKLFSKWRHSAMLNLRKLPFWSQDLYRHVILHLCSKFIVDRPIWRRDIAKKTIFNMASVRHLEFEKFRFFVKSPAWELKFTSAYQIRSKSDNSWLRYAYNAIINMAAVRHLEFAKIAVLVMGLISACDPSSLSQISR